MDYSEISESRSTKSYERRIRLTLYIITVFAFCLLEYHKLQDYLDEAGYQISMIESVYMIVACGANLPYTSIAFLLLLENCYKSQLFTNREKVTAQLLTSFCAGLFAGICVLLFSLILAMVAGTKWSSEWTEPILINEGIISETVVPKLIYTTFSPVQGLLVSVTILILFWVAQGCALITFKEAHLYHLGVTMLFYLLFWNSIHLLNPLGLVPNWFFSLKSIIANTKTKDILAYIINAATIDLVVIIGSVICNVAREHYCHK